MSKQAMQVILRVHAATFIPRTAKMSVWVTSMHKVEQGSLLSADKIQWAMNPLSSSQVAMLSSQETSQRQQNNKFCKYYNEGS